MRKIKIILLALAETIAGNAWADYHKPSVQSISENYRGNTWFETGAFIEIDKSEGVKFVMKDHPDQVHGIKDGHFSYESKVGFEKRIVLTSPGKNRQSQKIGSAR